MMMMNYPMGLSLCCSVLSVRLMSLTFFFTRLQMRSSLVVKFSRDHRLDQQLISIRVHLDQIQEQ